MNEGKNILGLIGLIIIILTFTVGGYFLMNYMTKETEVKNNNKNNNENNIVDLRIDKTKDYIYYENGEEIIEEEEIHQDEAILNFTTLTSLNDTLRDEEKKLYQDIKYVKDMDLPVKDEDGNDIMYNENEKGIYSVKYRDYNNYKYNDYVSLTVVDYDYDIKNGSCPFALKSYVIDINKGTIISEDELLTKYNISKETIKDKIKERLNNTQVLDESQIGILDIDGTLNDLKYTLYINKTGRLTVSFIVKSKQINYNDIVVLN